MKSPFNWVGNKLKFLVQINEIVTGKHYLSVIDLFMGSGNVLLNLDCIADKWYGNDRQRLIPSVFTSMKDMEAFSYMEVESILDRNARFSSKESYYSFRDEWNTKYFDSQFDRVFVLETALLLKMCSNSMVRFNTQGVFNQGFRGLGADKEFFKGNMLQDIVNQLNHLLITIQSRNFKFTHKDFKSYEDEGKTGRLLILDPPYALGDTGMYNQEFSASDGRHLLSLLETTRNDFIYFNYLEHGNNTYAELRDLIARRDFRVIDIGDNNVSAGQGGKIAKHVREVMVTNVHL
jgi:site-specific DNA-adenine methylase